MPDIYHDFPVNGSVKEVYECVSTPVGLSRWWSKNATGIPGLGNKYEFDFGPGYQWEAVVTGFQNGSLFSLKMILSDSDWKDSVVSFELTPAQNSVTLHFSHIGWPENNPHYKSSSYCWAMYLRCLKGYVEKGIELEYELRLEGV